MLRSRFRDMADTARVDYPVRLAPPAPRSSHARGHTAPRAPQLLVESRRDTAVRGASADVIQNHANALVTRELSSSRAGLEHSYQAPTVARRYSRATPAHANLFLHGGDTCTKSQLRAFPFTSRAHGRSEAQDAYLQPSRHSTAAVAAGSYTLPTPDIHCESSAKARTCQPAPAPWCAPPLPPPGAAPHPSADSYARLLDQRPRIGAGDVVTYYTHSGTHQVRGLEGAREAWRRGRGRSGQPPDPAARPRLTRLPQQATWTPTAFDTETAVSFVRPSSRGKLVVNCEDDRLREWFDRSVAILRPAAVELQAVRDLYSTESRDLNSGRLLAVRLDQKASKNTYR